MTVQPPKTTRGDATEMIVCVVAAAVFIYLLLQPPPDRPVWQTIGLLLMLGVALGRIFTYFSKMLRK